MEPQPSSQPQQHLPWLKLLGYGLQLFVVTMFLLFIMSVIAGSDQPADFWWAGAAVAIPMAGCSWLFSLRLKPATKKLAATYGLIWAVMLAVIILVIAIPNKTTGIVFGKWSTYLVFFGVAVGPVIFKQKPAVPNPKAIK